MRHAPLSYRIRVWRQAYTSPTFLRGDSTFEPKLSSLDARSNAFTRQRVLGPAAGGTDRPTVKDFLVVTKRSHHDSVSFRDLLQSLHSTGSCVESQQLAEVRVKPGVARALPFPHCKMTLTPARTLLLLTFLVAPSTASTAQTLDDDPHHHIRTTDRRLIRLVQDGVRASHTFRRMVDRIRQSDVIVYLECGVGTRSADGRLTFISSVAGHRYVHVRVARLATADVQIALIGHELRHVVEIADAPAVVDDKSLAREYERIGFLNARQLVGTSYDSDAAVEAGYQVLRDLTGRAAGQLPTPNLPLPTAAY